MIFAIRSQIHFVGQIHILIINSELYTIILNSSFLICKWLVFLIGWIPSPAVASTSLSELPWLPTAGAVRMAGATDADIDWAGDAGALGVQPGEAIVIQLSGVGNCPILGILDITL